MSRPAVSQHLGVLKRAGLVVDTAEGTRRLYRVDPDGVDEMRAYLDRFWHRSLAAFKEVAERPSKEAGMTVQSTRTSVRTSVVVDAPAERAFDVFVHEMASWWHPDHHLLSGELAEMVVEPRPGGRIFDRGVDGTECQWASVLAYEPPRRFTFSWNISARWEVEPDPAKASEVEVRFIPEGPGRTHVELEHRHLERHGDGWEGMRDAVGAPDGWPDGLSRYAAHVGAGD